MPTCWCQIFRRLASLIWDDEALTSCVRYIWTIQLYALVLLKYCETDIRGWQEDEGRSRNFEKGKKKVIGMHKGLLKSISRKDNRDRHSKTCKWQKWKAMCPYCEYPNIRGNNIISYIFGGCANLCDASQEKNSWLHAKTPRWKTSRWSKEGNTKERDYREESSKKKETYPKEKGIEHIVTQMWTFLKNRFWYVVSLEHEKWMLRENRVLFVSGLLNRWIVVDLWISPVLHLRSVFTLRVTICMVRRSTNVQTMGVPRSSNSHPGWKDIQKRARRVVTAIQCLKVHHVSLLYFHTF